MGSFAPAQAKHKFFLATTCILASAPIIKLGDIQLLEVFFFFHLMWLALGLIARRYRVRINDLWRSLGICYVIFFIAVLALSAAALRFHFYPPQQDMGFLKWPFVLSVARVAELFLGTFHMLYLAAILRHDPPARLYAVRFYFWTGFATACYSLLSYPVLLATDVMLGAYLPDLRTRGLFNEGGPYGLFMISIMVVGLVLYRTSGLTKKQIALAATIIVPAFFMAQSKSAILACFLLFLLNILIVGSLRLRVSLFVGALILASAIMTFTSFTNNVMGYINAYQLVQDMGTNLDGSAYGGFGGRLAGAILVPRMIAAHPATGIGLGNYPLVFDDPNYLQGLPYTSSWESPSIGIAGYVAELGFPLFAYLLFILCIPLFQASRNRAEPTILILAAVQPLVHLFGAQLNFYYPWICSGFALSFLNFRLPETAQKRSSKRIVIFSAFRHARMTRLRVSR